MAESIDVTPKHAAKVVMQRWDDLCADTIIRAATEIWHASAHTDTESDDYEADLLAALAWCKELTTVRTAKELLSLWQVVEDGHERGHGFGGLIYGEDSSNYQSVRKFIEGLFVPLIIRFAGEEFDRLATEANMKPEGQPRIDAFEEVGMNLEVFVDNFELSEVAQRKVVTALNEKTSLIEQQIALEEERLNRVATITSSTRKSKKTK